MSDPDVIIWAAAGLAALWCAVKAYQAARHRRELAEFAVTNGLRYDPQFRPGIPDQVGDMWLARRGHHRRSGHLLQSATAHGVVVLFSCWCELGRGGRRRDILRSVAAGGVDADLPAIYVGPVDECRAAQAVLGFHVVISPPFLPQGFGLASEVPPAMLQLPHAGWPALGEDECLECRGDSIVACRPGMLGPRLAEELIARLGQWSAFLRSWPHNGFR